jgi:hypothetical protein
MKMPAPIDCDPLPGLSGRFSTPCGHRVEERAHGHGWVDFAVLVIWGMSFVAGVIFGAVVFSGVV